MTPTHMTGHVQWLMEQGERRVGVLRVYGPGLGFANMDPYLWACTIQQHDPQTCELHGVAAETPIGVARAIATVCREMGFTRMRRTSPGGKVRYYE